MQGVNADSRRAVFDIFCEGADGILYYASFAIQMQADIEREKFKRATPEELELPKFRLELSECDTIYKKFLYALNNIGIMNNLPKEMDDQLFRKLKSAIELQRMNAKERLAYEISISAERDLSACMEASYAVLIKIELRFFVFILTRKQQCNWTHFRPIQR